MNDVTILMATYNGEKYIAEQIESIISQSYTDWKLIIQDDVSSDRTCKIIQEYEAKYPDKITLLQNEKGTGAAKNNFLKLIRHAPKSKYYMFCDQDDFWQKEKIANSIRTLKEEKINDDIPVAFYSDLKVVDENLKVMNDSFFSYTHLKPELTFQENLIQNSVTGCTILLNEAMLKELQEIDETDFIKMHDWMISLIGNSFGKLIYSNHSQILYRQHSSNSVGATGFYNQKRPGMQAMKAQFRKNSEEEIMQAKTFLKVYRSSLNQDYINCLEKFISLNKASKWKKIITYYRYGIVKYGFFRKIKQIVFA